MTDSKREPENTGKIRGSNTKRGGNVLIFVVAAVLALSAGIGFSHFRAQRTARMDSVSRELLPDRDTSSNRFEPSPDTSVATRSPQVTAEEKQRIRKILATRPDCLTSQLVEADTWNCWVSMVARYRWRWSGYLREPIPWDLTMGMEMKNRRTR